MKSYNYALITGLLGLYAGSLGVETKTVFDNSSPKEPKNKFKLTEAELEQMKTMTPKEKKLFLKGRPT